MEQNLALINNSRTDWIIRVRITRMWPSFGNNQHFIGFNLILLDSEDYHVIAFVYPVLWLAIGNTILEGNTYKIENFLVKAPLGCMRPVSSDKVVVFTTFTKILNFPIPVGTIPRHKFEIQPFVDVHAIAASFSNTLSPLYAIDIVGVAQNIESVKHVKTSWVDRIFLRFELYDGSNVIKIIAWDEHTEVFASLLEGNFDMAPIVVLTSMRPRIFHGSLQVSTSDSSKIYINIDYEAVRVMRQRLLDQAYEPNIFAP